MTSPKLYLRLIVLGVILGAVSNTYAFSGPRLNLEDYHSNLGAVYIAQVENIEPRFGMENHGYPLTKVELTVVQGVTNNVGEGMELTFYLPEGNINDAQTMSIGGSAKFHDSGQFLLFHRQGVWHQSPVYGWENGLFQSIYHFELGYDILLNTQGKCLLGLNQEGLLTSHEMVMDPPKYVVAQTNDVLVYESYHSHDQSIADEFFCPSSQDVIAELEQTFGYDFSNRSLSFTRHTPVSTLSIPSMPAVYSSDDFYDAQPSCIENPNAKPCILDAHPSEIFTD